MSYVTPQTWWVGVTLSGTCRVCIGLVTWGQDQVKFQVAPVELKLGSSNPEDRGSIKLISIRMPSNVTQGQRSGQISNNIAPIQPKLGESNSEDMTGMKMISKRTNSKVTRGQRSSQI